MNKKIGVFAGTFDPITIGHEEIIKKASDLFDNLVIAICINKEKTATFDIETRLKMVKSACLKFDNCKVVYHEGMLVDLMKKLGAKYYVRGVRDSVDFEYEKKTHFFNKKLYPEIITVYIPCDEDLLEVSSTKVRKLIELKKDLSGYLSKEVLSILQENKAK